MENVKKALTKRVAQGFFFLVIFFQSLRGPFSSGIEQTWNKQGSNKWPESIIIK